MNTVVFLMLFPLLAAVVLLILPQHTVRKTVVVLSAGVLIAASCYLLVTSSGSGTGFFAAKFPGVDQLMMGIEALLAVYIVFLSLRHKQYFTAILMAVQAVLVVIFEFTRAHGVMIENNILVDEFAIIMALIIGVIGSLICVYAVGYMKDYHHHHSEVKNRTPFFFFIMFVFLSAMFGLVFANNLMWLYFFWEITTLCSFLLIGYTQSEQAIKNAFRALWMNLLGGLAFVFAIIYIVTQADVMELDKLLALDKSLVLVPAVLLGFAGITKAAQFPFSSWLLGAMIAPTPTSALLHSSTMVKAGVYIIIRLTPVYFGTVAGILVALVGATTFLLASCIAISQLDAKKVLAYSTVANLGLIIACAGCGTTETVWAAIFLVIFHAVAKSLLFLSVGPVEHNLGDRGIETMEGLITKIPFLAIVMVIGIAGMFLAPFGMLISKWAALGGIVKANPILAIFVAFGSAATLFFWTKWMGKVLIVKKKPADFTPRIDSTEHVSLLLLAVLTVGICLLFPVISNFLVEPYLQGTFSQVVDLGSNNVIIMLIMMGLILLLPARLYFYRDLNYVEVYLGGANAGEEGQFMGSLGTPRSFAVRNYYLERYFGEEKLFGAGVLSCLSLILIMFGVGML